MESTEQMVNTLLVDVFNDILTIEEKELNNGKFKDVTISEVHTIDAVGMYNKKTMSEIAKQLSITVGTLTVAINNLVQKGYVERFKSEDDKRVVKIGLTKNGRLLFRMHQKFHMDMVKTSFAGLNEEQGIILKQALSNLHGFLVTKYHLK